MADQTSLSLTDSRERRLNRIKDLFGEATNAKAIDSAAHHAVQTERDLEELERKLENRFQREANRHELGAVSISVSVEADF